MKSFFIYTMILVLWPSMLWADEYAESLSRQLQGVLDQQAAVLEAQGHILTQEGDMVVEPSGQYYAVTSPYLSLKAKTGHIISIGMIAANAVPKTEGQGWSMAVALPTPIRITGTAESRIDIESQRTVLGVGKTPLILQNGETKLQFTVDNLDVLTPLLDVFVDGLDSIKSVLTLLPGGRYTIEATSDGTLLVNGRDLGALMALVNGGGS